MRGKNDKVRLAVGKIDSWDGTAHSGPSPDEGVPRMALRIFLQEASWFLIAMIRQGIFLEVFVLVFRPVSSGKINGTNAVMLAEQNPQNYSL